MTKSSDILNISSNSVENKFCEPVLSTRSEIGTQRSGGPSTIVVMMNGNSNPIYPHYGNEQSSIHLENRNIQESPNTTTQFQPRTTSTERYTLDNMPYQEKENIIPKR